MDYKNVVLTICIPTYNRAEILNKTLKCITNDSGFDDEIEIIISDNSSQDNTEEICKDYTDKYHNIHYYRNENNIGIRNFYYVLKHGNGRYLKIINDTVTFKPNKLREIKEFIKNSDENRAILFPPSPSKRTPKSVIYTETKDDVLNKLSYNTTWSPVFGIWRKDFENVCKEEDAESLIPQVIWIYKESVLKPLTLVFDDYYLVEWTGNKGNYNYMHTFVEVYLNILRNFSFSHLNFELEKYRLLGLLTHYYYMMKYKNIVTYDSTNAFKIIYKEYWYEPYFYVKFPALIFARLLYNKVLKKH